MTLTWKITNNRDIDLYWYGGYIYTIERARCKFNIISNCENNDLIWVYLYCNIDSIEGIFVDIIKKEYTSIAKKINLCVVNVDDAWEQDLLRKITAISNFNGTIESIKPTVDLSGNLEKILLSLKVLEPNRIKEYYWRLVNDSGRLDKKLQEYIEEQKEKQLAENKEIRNGNYLYKGMIETLNPQCYGGGGRMVRSLPHPFYYILHYGLLAKEILKLEKDKLDEYIEKAVRIEINIEKDLINKLLRERNAPTQTMSSRFNRG